MPSTSDCFPLKYGNSKKTQNTIIDGRKKNQDLHTFADRHGKVTWKFAGGLLVECFEPRALHMLSMCSPIIAIPRTIPSPKQGYSYGPAIVFLDEEINPYPYRIIHKSQMVELINRSIKLDLSI